MRRRRAGDVDHLLVQLAIAQPALHELDALERRTGRVWGTGVCQRGDADPKQRSSVVWRFERAAHRYTRRIACGCEVDGLA
jgi:hypothetical protein